MLYFSLLISNILSNLSLYFSFQNIFIHLFNFLFYLFLTLLFAKYISQKFKVKNFYSYYFYPLTLINLASIFYYFFNFTNHYLAIFFFFFNLIIIFLIYKEKLKIQIQLKNIFKNIFVKIQNSNKIEILSFILLNFLYFLIFYLLFTKRFDYPLRSFWYLLGASFFYLLFFTIFFTFLFLYFSQRKNLKIISQILLLNLSISFALILYKYFYGFDPFIHEATLKEIATKGFIEPKPLYYLNYYSIIILAKKLFNFNIEYLNQFLTFIFYNILLIPVLYKYFQNKLNNSYFILFLIFPFTLFINSTPQALANLLVLALIFSYLIEEKITLFHYLLGISIFLIHPLSGIPILLILFFLNSSKKIFKTFWALNISFALPIAFYLFNFLSPNFVKLHFTLNNYVFFNNLLNFHFRKQYNFFRDLLYLILDNKFLIYIFFIIFLLYFFYKKEKKYLQNLFIIHLLLILSYLLSLNLDFQQLINYEKFAYINRILTLSFYFLYPIILYLIIELYKKIQNNKQYTIIFFFLISNIILASIYISYPRDDQYHLDRAYNLSISDIKAVHLIQEKAKTEKYIVLASQITSVTALKEFGFHHHLKTKVGEIYYYPIPSSGPLYQEFLTIVYKNFDQNYIDSLFDKYKVKEIFIAIPAYWHNLKNILNNLDNSKYLEKFTIEEQVPIYIYHYIQS